MKRREPSAVPSMLQSPWHVPIRWFVLVDDDDRRLVETESGDYRLYYWTPIGVAKRPGVLVQRSLYARSYTLFA